MCHSFVPIFARTTRVPFIQSFARFEDEFWGNSPGWWAATVATYCLSRVSQLAQKNITKHGERADENRCSIIVHTCVSLDLSVVTSPESILAEYGLSSPESKFVLAVTADFMILFFMMAMRMAGVRPESSPLPTSVRRAMSSVVSTASWRQLYNIRSYRKIDSQRLFSREKDFPKTFSLTENQFSRKIYFYTIHP